MKILIAVPCMDQVPVPFCHSLALLRKPDNCVLTMKTGSLIYIARNELATAAIQSEADLVFWLDSDMVFQPDTLERMLKTLQKPRETAYSFQKGRLRQKCSCYLSKLCR